jgi:Type I restriction enzyme R protein N terminus (HSDR_N)
MSMTKKVQERFVAALKAVRPVIEGQKARDVSEADTVTLVKDILSDVLGYDKYADLTSEFSIRGTYCDIAIRVEGKVWCLVEVKSAGTNLDDKHVKQAIDYAANNGVEWCALTNGWEWRLFHVVFAKPIDKQLVTHVDLQQLNVKSEDELLRLFTISKEGFSKGAHCEARDRINATSRHLLAALLVSNDDVIQVLRRELRRLVDVKVEVEHIIPVLEQQVIKRDCLDGPEAQAALARVKRGGKPLRASSPKADGGDGASAASEGASAGGELPGAD